MAGRGTPGAVLPGDLGPAASSASASATIGSVYRIQCGDDINQNITDSAGLIWAYSVPHIISPGRGSFTSATNSYSGIVAPLDQGDPAHQLLLRSTDYDQSATVNGGPPGALEYSLSVEGNVQYNLRLWAPTFAVTFDYKFRVSYDYGPGTTTTFSQTLAPWVTAQAPFKSVEFIENFTITATGAQSMRLMVRNSGTSPEAYVSAFEISGIAYSAVIPVGPVSGRVFIVGKTPDVRLGLKAAPATGVVTIRGSAVTLSSRLHKKSPTSGRVFVVGGQVPVSTGLNQSPISGRVTTLGGVPESHVLFAQAHTPSSGRVFTVGHAVPKPVLEVGWTDEERDTDTEWVEVVADG